MSTEVFRVEKRDQVAGVWLANPDRRNAMGPDFWEQLPAVMAEVGADAEVRAVVLAADGPAFTVGLDLKAMGGTLAGGAGSSIAAQKTAFMHEIRRLQGSITSVAECPKPVIAAVHGWCIGGGIDLITAADIRLASSDAKFSVRETKMAMVADVGTLQRLPHVIARGHVAELAYTGKDIDAARAAEIGLVNHVYDGVDALHAAAFEMAAEIAANSPLAVQGAKELLSDQVRAQVDAGLRAVSVWNAAFLPSDDLTEAVMSFMQKRPAEFKGS